MKLYEYIRSRHSSKDNWEKKNIHNLQSEYSLVRNGSLCVNLFYIFSLSVYE